MKKLLITLLGLASASFSSAATIAFYQESAHFENKIKATGPGIDGLGKLTDLPEGKEFNIQTVHQGVVNSTLAISSFKPNGQPYLSSGALSWRNEDKGDNSYEFDISAGGNPGEYDPTTVYCINVSVDGHEIGKNCTNSKVYWDPTIVVNQKFTANSKVKVYFTNPTPPVSN